MKSYASLTKPSFWLGVIFCFFAVLSLLVTLEKNNLQNIGKEKSLKLLELSSVFQHSFDNTLSDYQNIVSVMYPDKSLMNEAVVRSTEFDTFRRCNISEREILPSGVQISPVNYDKYHALPFQHKLNILLFCNVTNSVANILESKSNTDHAFYLGLVVENVDALFSDFHSSEKNNPALTNSRHNKNYQWVVSLEEMPISILENSDFKALRNAKNENKNRLYLPEIFIHQRMFANETALFFGDMETLFDFKAFDASPSDKLIVQLENITDYAPINSYTVLLYSPFVLFVSIFFVLFISYLVQSVVSLRRFFETLNTTDYTMLSAQSDLSHIKFILGNRYEGILEAEVFLLDESLKSVNTIVKAKYINFINDNGVYRFRLLASTFIREGQLFGYLLLMDASATQDRINEYELIYRTDSLTQLPNRTELDDFIKKTANSSAKYLMSIVDLDHFKSINDNFGHHFGDLVLQHSANHLKKSVKLNEDDRLIRMGGEEFIILLSLEAQVFDDACKSIAKRILNFNDEKISFSGGILLWEPDKKTFDSAYKQCDKLLYEAKESGRRQIRMLDYAGNKVVINEVSTRVDVINFQDQKSKVR